MNTNETKTAVITGGNSGIGKAIALELAFKGYRIIIHGKDAEKTKTAAMEISKISGNARIDYIAIDISTVLGMKNLASAIKSKTSSIDALVLSTGVILSKHILTQDGLEKGFAIQYLSRFATVQFLMDELMKGNAKIVLVGASKLWNAKVYLDDIALSKNFTMFRAMAQEMYCNHLFVQEFAKRYPNGPLLINMGNVGVSPTGITRNMSFILRWMVKLIGRSAEKVAKNFAYLASDPQVDFTGYFLNNPANKKSKTKIGYDDQTASQLWEKSMFLISAEKQSIHK